MSPIIIQTLTKSCSRDRRFQKKPWSRFITSENQRFISNEAIDFLDKLLRYDHQERLTAQEAMAHPYFEGVRKAEEEAAATKLAEGTTESETIHEEMPVEEQVAA